MSAQVVAVTAAKGGVGKSTVAVLLAAAAAATGQRVVLADLDYAAPAQADRNRVRFTTVPTRMPTVTDDAVPAEWFMDITGGFWLVPGTRTAADRTPAGYIDAGRRLIDRARPVMDLVVVDLHQVVTDDYTRALVGAVDTVVCVADHDAVSWDNLRSWLDAATTGGASFVAAVDTERVRLVYSEGVPLDRRRSDDRFNEARAALSRRYVWAARFGFDAGLERGGNTGELLASVTAATELEALRLASALTGTPVPDPPKRRRRRTPRPFEVARTNTAPPPHPTPPMRVVGDPGPGIPASEGEVMVRIFGTPDIADRAVDVATVAVAACVAVEGPMSIDTLAERTGIDRATLTVGPLASLGDTVRVDSDIVMRLPGTITDVETLRRISDQLIAGDLAAVDAAEMLAALGGPPVATDEVCWQWAHISNGHHEPLTATAARELAVCAARIADTTTPTHHYQIIELLQQTAERTGDPGGAITHAITRLTTDPVPSPAAEHPTTCVDDTEVVVSADDHPTPGVEPAPIHTTIPDAAAPAPTDPPGVDDPAQLEQAVLDLDPDHSPTPIVEPVLEAESAPVRPLREHAVGVETGRELVRWERPRVMLRTMTTPISIDGADVTNAVAVPFLLAAARCALPERRVAELTGYTTKTIANAYPRGSAVVERSHAELLLADGIDTDYAWVARCAHNAHHATTPTDTVAWITELVHTLNASVAAPWTSCPTGGRRNKPSPFDWIDDWPVPVSAVVDARRQLIEAVGTAATSAHRWGDPAITAVRSTLIPAMLRVARWCAFEPVSWSPHPGGAATSTLAATLTTNDPTLLKAVQYEVRIMINDGLIEPDDTLIATVFSP